MLRRTLLALVALCLAAGTARAETFEELRARFAREKEQPYAVRIQTVQAIAALGTESAARFLLDVVREDEDRSLQLNTIHQVARMPFGFVFDALLEIYRDVDSSLRSTAFHALANSREEGLPEDVLTEVFAGNDQGLRSNAIRHIGRRKDPRFIREVERFLERFPNSGSSMISALVEAKTPEAARILVEIYDDSRRYDREQIPKMFAEAGKEIRAVLGEMIRAAERSVKIHATTLASRAIVPEAEPAMVAAIPGKDTELWAILVEGIGAVGATTADGRRAILAALDAGPSEIVVAGIRAARRAPMKEAIGPLIERLRSAERLLEGEARVTLERITGQQYGDRIDLWQRWWEEYGEAFDIESVRPREAERLDQVLVDLAIERGVAALCGARGKDHPWEYASRPVGTTALVVLALHAAGLGRKDKAVKAGIKFLLESPVPQYTYDAALVVMALEAVGGRRYRRRIVECAKLLIETQLDAGLWGYPTGNGDNSNTQYAVLGLRAAARAGVKLPQRVWKKVRDHFLANRCEDGGFAYTVGNTKHSSASMTAAGVSCLLICLENTRLGEDEERVIRDAIDAAFTALGDVMKLDRDTLYALYGIERAGVLGRRTTMAGKPWYVPGALRLIERQGRSGFWTGNYNEAVQTAFAILFLKRATVPIATR